jgi:signal transduction histidine kinase
VLIVSHDPEFARQLMDRWQAERTVPSFTTLDTALPQNFERDAFEVAIVKARDSGSLARVLRVLDPSRCPVIVMGGPESMQSIRADFPRLLFLREHEGWPDTLVALASEVLRRVEAVNRAARAEQLNAHFKRNATLGQYVIDMRHTMNNALTSVLGNSELLLLEPGTFSAGVRSQLDTIRNMALRLHEILQRFSSLEKELAFVERQAAKEAGHEFQVAAGQ